MLRSPWINQMLFWSVFIPSIFTYVVKLFRDLRCSGPDPEDCLRLWQDMLAFVGRNLGPDLQKVKNSPPVAPSSVFLICIIDHSDSTIFYSLGWCSRFRSLNWRKRPLTWIWHLIRVLVTDGWLRRKCFWHLESTKRNLNLQNLDTRGFWSLQGTTLSWHSAGSKYSE